MRECLARWGLRCICPFLMLLYDVFAFFLWDVGPRGKSNEAGDMHGCGVIRLVCFSVSFWLCFMSQLNCSIDRIPSGFFINSSQFMSLQLLVASTLPLSLSVSVSLTTPSLFPSTLRQTQLYQTASVSQTRLPQPSSDRSGLNTKNLLRAPWGVSSTKRGARSFPFDAWTTWRMLRCVLHENAVLLRMWLGHHQGRTLRRLTLFELWLQKRK